MAASVASLSSSSGSSNDSPKVSSRLSSSQEQPTTLTPRTSCKNINVDTGVIVFDDIKDCDVNVTYDLIEGEFPPPNISGLVVRDPNDLLTSDDLPKVRNVTSDDVDSVSFGDEVDGRSEASSGGSKIIGDITIAEYEGSPRRYRPRATPIEAGGPSPDAAVAVKQPAAAITNNKRPLKLPGFPQRVLPTTPTAAAANLEATTSDRTSVEHASLSKEQPIAEPHHQEELLKFEEDQQGGHSSSSVTSDNKVSAIGSIETVMTVSSTTTADYDSKMRYEFSETRKVLDEFFQKDIAEPPELEVDLANSTSSSDLNNMPSSVTDFSDLNYVLRKNNNYVGQRLAASESTAEADPNKISPELELHIPNNDLLLTSPTPLTEVVVAEPPNTLAVASLMVAKGPQLGVSPLDQPLVNFSNMASTTSTTTTNTAVTNQHHVHDRHHKETTVDNNGDLELSSSPAPPPPVSNRGTAPTADNQQPPTLQTASNLAAVGGGCRPNDLESRNFTLSPETTDCDSADLESEMSVNEGSFHSSGPKMHTAMPVLEDGLSSGHASDLEDDVIYSR